MKQCCQCGLVLSLSCFSRDCTRKGGIRLRCKECDNARVRRWRENNLDKQKARNRQWRKNNPHKKRAQEARHRAAKRQATPPWASHSEIQKHYAHATHLEALLPGLKFQVDHIVPLQSDFVCGLHVENNLMVLEASQNASKCNRIWPGQLPCQTGSGPSQQWWNDLNNKLCSNA